MANIILPQNFRVKLESNQLLEGVVKITAATFGEILVSSNLEFFDEYTDHGINHIQDVLLASDNVISATTMKDILSPKDIGYYILSVILHDIGMHLTIGGFTQLINGQYDDVRVKELDKSTWSDIWEDFIKEAKKFNGKTLHNIFGDEATVIRRPPIWAPNELNNNDKKLIGEFIRRNHPRLAHEIALKGFPGQATIIKFASNLDDIKSLNLIGLISRSHGVGLRKCLDYIELIYGRSNSTFPNSVHAVFLMTVLRIADYIQIDSNRVSKTALKIKTFSSPVSLRENKQHLIVDAVHINFQQDPERIYVEASPKDNLMYLKLKNLIKDIQNELDISWAVLGEVYGHMPLKPELRFRRIISNLEDNNFIENQSYVPAEVSVKANEEILKLLIAPLYGNNPSFGVRELLQNSLDAVNERKEIENKENRSYQGIIKIKVISGLDKIKKFVITDNGIGMDVNVIKDYFLVSGASYRKSMEWQMEFQHEDGNSKIARNGRFGVGILASFLIGKRVYVETKKVGSTYGYKFSFDLNSDKINISKVNNIEIGTKIIIRIDQEVLGKLNPKYSNNDSINWWEWYRLSKPAISYTYFKKEVEDIEGLQHFRRYSLYDWNILIAPGYDKIFWKHCKYNEDSEFSCNGIIIPNIPEDVLSLGLISKRPHLCIVDTNEFLPLSLDRNSLIHNLQFKDLLLEEMHKDFIAYMLCYRPSHIINENKIPLSRQNFSYPGFSIREKIDFFTIYSDKGFDKRNQQTLLSNYLMSSKGFILCYSYFIKKLKSINVLYVRPRRRNRLNKSLLLDLKEHFFYCEEDPILNDRDELDSIFYNKISYESNSIILPVARTYFEKEIFISYYSNILSKISKNYKKEVKNYDNWLSLSIDYSVNSILSNEFLENSHDKLALIQEFTLNNSLEGYSLLDDLLQRYIGNDVIIPFSIEERKKKFPKAFEELENYTKKYLL